MASILRRVVRTGGYRVAIKVAKSVPIAGAAVAFGLAGYEIKKKGLFKGLVNTALDATPVVGMAKNTIEMFTGDWFPDKDGDESIERHGNQLSAQKHTPR
jgi:hypothetical protein